MMDGDIKSSVGICNIIWRDCMYHIDILIDMKPWSQVNAVINDGTSFIFILRSDLKFRGNPVDCKVAVLSSLIK